VADIAELRVRITADASGLKAVLLDAQQTVQRTGGVFSTLRDNITPLNQGIELLKNAFSGLVSIASGIAGAFAAPINAATAQDQALSGLEATLTSTNQLTAEYVGSLNELADAEALVKNVQDDVVLGAERTLIAFGAQRDQLPKLVDAVIDLSTKTGDVGGAAFIVGKALQGETGTLARYGIFVDEAASKSEKLDSALEQIQARFGGQAAAAAATFGGRLGIVGIAIGQVQERLGQVITQNPAVLTALSGIAAGFIAAKDALEPFLGPLDDVITGLAALATVKVGEGLEGIADAVSDFPALSAAIRAFAEALLSSNTAALEMKASLAEVQEQVSSGESGLGRFAGIVREIGPTGQIVFRTIAGAVREVSGPLKTLTETLNNADTQLKPLATLGENIRKRIKEALPGVQDQLVKFAIDVGEKMAVAIGKGIIKGILNAPAAIRQAGIERAQQEAADKVEAGWKAAAKNIGDALVKALSPAEAGAAEIPPTELRVDDTPARDTTAAFKKDAAAPVTASLELDASKAEATADSFISRLLSGMGEVAVAAAKVALFGPSGGTAAGPAPAAAAPAGPSPQEALAAAQAAGAAREEANRKVAAARQAEVAAAEKVNKETERAATLEQKRISLIEQASAKREAEFQQLAKGFNEINSREVQLRLNTEPAKTAAKSFDDEMKRFQALQVAPKVGLNTAEADKQAAAVEERVRKLDALAPTISPVVEVPTTQGDLTELENRVQRLDNLAPTIRPTVDLTTPSNDLQAMLDKAHELDSFAPDLKVEAGKSFEQAQSSVTALIARYRELNNTTAVLTPTVDTTQLETGFAEGQKAAEAFQASASLPAVVPVTGNTEGLKLTNKDLETFKKDASQPVALNVDGTKAQGTFSVLHSTLDKVSAKAKAGISLTADISQVQEKLGIIESDISAGVDPITIKAETTQVEAAIAKLKEDLKKITDPTEAKQAQLKIDDAERKLAKLKAQAEEPATKPVDADISAAQAKILELNAQIQAQVAANVANVARGGGQITGQAASAQDLRNILIQAGKDTAAAIAAGDEARLSVIAADLRDFRRSFGTFQGQTTIPAEIAQALSRLEGVLGGRGAFATVGGFNAGTLSASIGAELSKAQQGVIEKQQQSITQQADASRQSDANQEKANELLAKIAAVQERIGELRGTVRSNEDPNFRTPRGLEVWAAQIAADVRREIRKGGPERAGEIFTEVEARLEALSREAERTSGHIQETNGHLRVMANSAARTAAATERTAATLASGRAGGFLTASVQDTARRTTGSRASVFG
jgi:hypothetical protein